jgi:predicted Zn-dependent protease
MEFKARAPREGINVSDTHPLKEAALLVAGLLLLVTGLAAVAAWSVDLAVRFISPEAEARAFASLGLDPLVETVGQLEDERQDAVRRVLDKLLVHWPEAAYDFKVLVLSSNEANAAALPGGYVLVTSGLIAEVETENELAFVLGHELGHFHNRDHLRRLGRGVVYSLALAVALGSSGSVPDVGTLIGELTSRSFDRAQERDADRFGLGLVEAEYGHIGSSWQFFQRLSEAGSNLDHLVAYLSTHPASPSRIEDLRRYAVENAWPLDGPAEPFGGLLVEKVE